MSYKIIGSTSNRKMLKTNSVIKTCWRLKHGKNHWSNVQNKKDSIDRALDSFDDFYGAVYGTRWKSIRVAMLTEHKYVALVNNFSNVFETIEQLENLGTFNVRQMYYAETNNPQEKNLRDLTKAVEKQGTKTFNQFVQAKEESEISALYPNSAEHISNVLPVAVEREVDDPKLLSPQIDFRKSLNESIKEDSQIDYRRVIDGSQVGEAGLHEFVPVTKLKGMDDWILESDHYKYYSDRLDFPVNRKIDHDIEISENLNIYTYEPGNVSEFPKPKNGLTGVLSHFMMDGASILPPILLNVQPGDRVLDACAAPGGKSLLLMQTMWPSIVVCNDVQESRVNRIRNVMNQYLYNFEEKWNKKRIILTQNDARVLNTYDSYDKILVDVPCTADRHSVMKNDNNIFKPSRIKERLRLPELQAGILTNCLRLLKPGGTLVYSTCSLSPVQNDGVVHMALSQAFREHNITVTINDLAKVINPLRPIFRFQNPDSLKYGQLVLPFLTSNFGPMYFSKITRDT